MRCPPAVSAYLGVFPLGGMLLGGLSDALSVKTSLLVAGLGCGALALFVLLVISVPGEDPA
ncbi:MAG: hypothetical protein KKF41_12240 [Actinobacteria bacterium]|nr:hypothetical protein [Actinomycetota bacterium]MBU2688345.1 hypothetical protein [Actinomycetota bacterium]